jgi:hypothetical protein
MIDKNLKELAIRLTDLINDQKAEAEKMADSNIMEFYEFLKKKVEDNHVLLLLAQEILQLKSDIKKLKAETSNRRAK